MKLPFGHLIFSGCALIITPVLFNGAAQAQAQTDIPAPSAQLKAGLDAYDNFRYEEAVQVLKPLADQGDAQAQYIIAMMHSFGQGGLEDSPVLLPALCTNGRKAGASWCPPDYGRRIS